MAWSTCIPLTKLVTGLPSFSQVRLGAGIPLASHSNLTRLLTTTATMLLLPKIDGGTGVAVTFDVNEGTSRHIESDVSQKIQFQESTHWLAA